jgi:hypothetical protein
MSIHKFIKKIKKNILIDKTTLLFSTIIIGVALLSFGLGRISTKDSSSNYIKELQGAQVLISLDKDNNQNINKGNIDIVAGEEVREKNFVASKNGKMYYTLDCGGAKRIKVENQIYFYSEAEAQEAGYERSLTCK